MKYLLLVILLLIFLPTTQAQFNNIPPPRPMDRTHLSDDNLDAYIVAERTGFNANCIDCRIRRENCLIEFCEGPNNSNFTVLDITTGAQNVGTVSVAVNDTIFPAGTYAGWTYYYEGAILATGWDISAGPLSIATYLNGEFQEGLETPGSDMVTGLGIFRQGGNYYVEMETTKPYNEIQVIIDFGEISNIEFARIPFMYVGTTDNSDALVVDWLDFSAQAADNSVELQWSLATAENVEHFVVERFHSTTNHFTAVETVEATEKSTSSTYQFFDKSPLTGSTQYRIKVVETDGQLSYSPLRVVHFAPTHQRPYSVLENPVTQQQLHLNIQEPLLLRLIDGNGSVLQKTDYQSIGQQQLQLNNLSAGIYYLQLQTNRDRWVEKIVVR